MAAYAMVELEITNMERFRPYLEAVGDTVAAHGGRYLVRAGKTEVAEGGLGQYPTKVIIEFPSMEAAKGWYQSKAYQAILPHRTDNSKGNFVWVEGV